MLEKYSITKTQKLAGDASSREYFRLSADKETYILMRQEPFSANSNDFLLTQKHLNDLELNVPQIIDINEADGEILLEDLGDIMLESFPESDEYYEKTLQQLYKLQTTATKQPSANCPAYSLSFDNEKLGWEFNYFLNNTLKGYLKLSNLEALGLENDFNKISSYLANRPQYFCHRDFHSRNIMIQDKKAILIDFQDARMGPLSYDLVSLFYDSYVDLSPEFIERHLNQYMSQFKSHPDFEKEFLYQSIQRGLKACGTFGGQAHLFNKTQYLKYLKPTLNFCYQQIKKASEFKALEELFESTQLIKLAGDKPL